MDFEMDANNAVSDVLDIVALKEREITMLKLQLAALARQLQKNDEEVEKDGV